MFINYINEKFHFVFNVYIEYVYVHFCDELLVYDSDD